MLVSVALPLPLFQAYTYSVPDDLAQRASLGSRVVVPVRGRKEMGVVVGDGVPRDGVRPKPILEAPDDLPMIGAPLLRVCRWIADYYAAPLGVVLRTALPSALTGAATPVPTPKTRRLAVIARELPTLMERDEAFARAKKQREVYELLESLGGRAPVELLLERMAFSPAVL